MSTLIRFERPVQTLSSLLNDFYSERSYESVNREVALGQWPRVDIEEASDKYLLKADIPGLERSDVAITVDKGTLRLEGEEQAEHKQEKGRYYHRERSYGKFSRSFTLPDDVDAENVGATMKNGVLEITIPKSEKAKPRTIEVSVN